VDISYAVPGTSFQPTIIEVIIMMLPSFRLAALRLALCSIVICLLNVSTIRAQEFAKNAVKTTVDSTEPTVNERVRVLEAELEKQNAKLDQLQKTIADQQTAIQALLNKLSGPKAAAADEPLSTTSAVASTAEAAPTPQPPTVEQRRQ
jgi:uncharacterized protein YlxW (UPF0749 family)